MSIEKTVRLLPVFAFTCAAAVTGPALAGNVFITGHDPDFHAQDDPHAVVLLETGLSFVTGGTFNQAGSKFLWVESNDAVTSGHRFGENALTGALGLVEGVNFDHVDAA